MKYLLTALCFLCASSLFAQFKPGDQVQVDPGVGTRLNVRSTAVVVDGNIVGTEAIGAKGTILAGPIGSATYTFWQVKFTDLTGYCAGKYLALSAVAPPPVDTSGISIQLQGFKVVQVLGDSIIIVKER
jgi:hypothetical protein